MADDAITPKDIDSMKKALVNAGFLKSKSLSKTDQNRVNAEMSRLGLDKLNLKIFVICHSQHYCIIVKGLN